MTHDLEDLLAAAKGRDKASIGLPPDGSDDDASAVFIIGTTSQFGANPVRFDRILPIGKVMNVEPTTQTVGVVDGQIVIKIEVPDLPGAADIIDEAADAASIGVAIGTWALLRPFKIIARNQLILEIQKIRLDRAKKVAAAFGTGPKRRFRATIRTARVGRSIVGRTASQGTLLRKTKSIRFIATRVGAKVLFKAILVVSLAIDILFVAHRTAKGVEQEGVPGGVGGLVAGLFDVVTFGLAERQADTIEVKTTSATRVFLDRLGGAFRPRVA